MPHSTRRVRVLCAGFHPLILEDSRIQAGDECEIHTISADEDMLLRTIDRIRPDVILLDLLQTGSLRTIQRVRDTSPSSPVVALTGMRRADTTGSIFLAGASGILYRSDAAAELSAAIQIVQSGQRYLSPAFTKSSTDAAGARSRSPIQLSASDCCSVWLRRISWHFGSSKSSNRRSVQSSS